MRVRMRRSIRVLVVGHSYVVGINQSKLDTLVRTGEVEIALLTPQIWIDRELQRTLKLERPFSTFRVYSSGVWFPGRSGAYIYPPSILLRVFLEFKPDIVHVDQEIFAASASQLALFSRLFGKKLTLAVYESVDREFSLPRRMAIRLVSRSVRFLFAGNADAVRLCRKWGYTGPSTVLSLLGVDTSVFRPRGERNTKRTFVIGYVGRLVPEKGVDLLLHAGQRLMEKGYGVRFVVVGEGPDQSRLRELAWRMGLSDFVVWRGWVPHASVADEIASMDVLVLPSRGTSKVKEQFGRVLVEAMATGVPVVGSSCGAIPDVIGNADLIFPEGDPEKLAFILERLIRDRDWYLEAREHGLKRAELFTNEKIAEQMVQVWKRLAAVSGTGG